MDDIAAYVKERDEALLSGDIDKVRDLYTKHNPGLRAPPHEVLEMAMHKARTAAINLPVAEREKSKAWLLERGLSHFGDE